MLSTFILSSFFFSQFSVFFHTVFLIFFPQVLFGTLDPPDPPVLGVPGHFCVVAVNLASNRFELLDSLRGPDDPDAKRVLHTMATNIKKLWRGASDAKGVPFQPKSIDNWEYDYVRVPRQLNT